jgi:hypothetical protein
VSLVHQIEPIDEHTFTVELDFRRQGRLRVFLFAPIQSVGIPVYSWIVSLATPVYRPRSMLIGRDQIIH